MGLRRFSRRPVSGTRVILARMLYLASQSPRRRELLARLGVPFDVLAAEVPEVREAGESPTDYVRRVAREKAGAGLLALASVEGAAVLGGDTEVVLDGRVFGKPGDDADAVAMLRALSGRTHQVISAVSLVSAAREAQAVSISEVTFADLDDADIERYVGGGEPRGRAGAYAIQGYAEAFVTRFAGSHSGVMGLPLRETAELLRQFGIAGAATAPGRE